MIEKGFVHMNVKMVESEALVVSQLWAPPNVRYFEKGHDSAKPFLGHPVNDAAGLPAGQEARICMKRTPVDRSPGGFWRRAFTESRLTSRSGRRLRLQTSLMKNGRAASRWF